MSIPKPAATSHKHIQANQYYVHKNKTEEARTIAATCIYTACMSALNHKNGPHAGHATLQNTDGLAHARASTFERLAVPAACPLENHSASPTASTTTIITIITAAAAAAAYSHSMVLGGLLVISYTTRFTLRTCRQK